MIHKHIINQIFNPTLKSDSTLYVVGVVSNPIRYHSRYRIAREWIKSIEQTPHVQLMLVETAFGDRQHELTDPSNPWHLQLRNKTEIWIKESMVNLGVRRVLANNPQARYLAWIDTDVFFRDPGWALETIHQLQHFQVVQPWQTCSDLGPRGASMRDFRSFGYQHQRRCKKQMHPDQPYEYAHSGFAWACTRSFWEHVIGLVDFPILGSGDHHMAFAMTGEVDKTIKKGMNKAFFRKCHEWQDRATRACYKEVGFVPGHIEHQFHGPKGRRYYRGRWGILIDHDYNPDKDIVHDPQGLVTLVGKPALEQAIRLYNRSRHEDSIEEQ